MSERVWITIHRHDPAEGCDTCPMFLPDTSGGGWPDVCGHPDNDREVGTSRFRAPDWCPLRLAAPENPRREEIEEILRKNQAAQ